jgi:hypothetical protein
MTFWALAWSSQKSGPADCFSRLVMFFSLPAMSKMLHGLGHPGFKIFQPVFQFLHVVSPFSS